MPVLRSIRERFAAERPLEGVQVAACLHVTAETANLVRTLIAGGAQTPLCAANPLSTRDEVAAALVERHGATVQARRGEGPDDYARHIGALVKSRPQITLDDGADLISTLHAAGADDGMLGVDGGDDHRPGARCARWTACACPVLAVNDARTERTINDRFGTGQSAFDGILRATNLLLSGRTVVVFGYGWTGKGIALRARGAGAEVVVCEVDPLRALEARMEGFGVMPSLEAAERGDVFITVTGGRDVIGAEHFSRMKDGAVLANAGHFDVEIDLAGLTRPAGAGPRGAAAGRAVHAARRPPPEPAGPRARGQPGRRRGPSRRGDGRQLRAAGAVRRVPGPRGRRAAVRRPAGPRRDRPRGRPAEAGRRWASRSTC